MTALLNSKHLDQLASKLELELPFRSKFKLNLLCRLDGSCCPAATALRLRLLVSSGKYCPGKFSDSKGQAGQVDLSKGNADSSIYRTCSGIYRTSSGKADKSQD